MILEKARFVLGQIAHGMIRPQKEINEAVNTVFSELDKRIWIPVTERLPDEGVEVLVTVEVDGKTYIENGIISAVRHGVWDTIYDRYEQEVYQRNRNAKFLAWMPLPEPYKGGDAECNQ